MCKVKLFYFIYGWLSTISHYLKYVEIKKVRWKKDGLSLTFFINKIQMLNVFKNIILLCIVTWVFSKNRWNYSCHFLWMRKIGTCTLGIKKLPPYICGTEKNVWSCIYSYSLWWKHRCLICLENILGKNSSFRLKYIFFA